MIDDKVIEKVIIWMTQFSPHLASVEQEIEFKTLKTISSQRKNLGAGKGKFVQSLAKNDQVSKLEIL